MSTRTPSRLTVPSDGLIDVQSLTKLENRSRSGIVVYVEEEMVVSPDSSWIVDRRGVVWSSESVRTIGGPRERFPLPSSGFFRIDEKVIDGVRYRFLTDSILYERPASPRELIEKAANVVSIDDRFVSFA